jgi:hypothetical protein
MLIMVAVEEGLMASGTGALGASGVSAIPGGVRYPHSLPGPVRCHRVFGTTPLRPYDHTRAQGVSR